MCVCVKVRDIHTHTARGYTSINGIDIAFFSERGEQRARKKYKKKREREWDMKAERESKK